MIQWANKLKRNWKNKKNSVKKNKQIISCLKVSWREIVQMSKYSNIYGVVCHTCYISNIDEFPGLWFLILLSIR